MNAAVSVLVVDDHEAFREAARAAIEATPGFAVAGVADSGERALTLVTATCPDMVLMDVRMPGMGGVEAARRLGASHPELLVVLLSTCGSDEAGEATPGPEPVIASKQSFGPAFLRSAWERRPVRRPPVRPTSAEPSR